MSDVTGLRDAGQPSPAEAPKIGNLKGKKVTLEKKHLFVALAVIGMIALAATGVGAASLGAQRGLWAAGSLSNIKQIAGISMMASGGSIGIAALVGGAFGLAKTREKKTSQIAALSFSLALPKIKGIKEQGASYDITSKEVIADLVYCNHDRGFACVVDGTGHNNERMRQALKKHFDPFIASYTEALSKTLEENGDADKFFESEMGKLDALFKNPELSTNQLKVCPENKEEEFSKDRILGTFLDPTFKPAMSFVQLVSCGDQLTLLTAQKSDTAIFIEDVTSQLKLVRSTKGNGLGQEDEPLNVERFDVTNAKRVILISDGIGEFLTLEELQQITQSTPDSRQLFSNLKKAVMSNHSERKTSIGANGQSLKAWKKDSNDHQDDMSLAVLDIPQTHFSRQTPFTPFTTNNLTNESH